MKSIVLFLFISLIACLSVKNDSDEVFDSPLKSYKLQEELNEASGLAYYSQEELVLVNDEKGILYFFDLEEEKVTRTIEFKKKGDFEGVTVVNNKLFALESNGTLYTIIGEEVSSIQLFDDGFDFEGLCYHEQRNSLLIACKEHSDQKKDDYIWIFEYDISNGRLEKKPFLKIARSKKLKSFRPSGITLHNNGNLFITSAVNRSIIEVDRNANVLNNFRLPKMKYPQVEGIAFDEQGYLFLVNEKASMSSAVLHKIKF